MKTEYESAVRITDIMRSCTRLGFLYLSSAYPATF
jgi:hypothetical protein